MKRRGALWSHFSTLSDFGGNFIFWLYASIVATAVLCFLVCFHARLHENLNSSFYLLLALLLLLLTLQTLLIEKFHSRQLDQFSRQCGLARQIDLLERENANLIADKIRSSQSARQAEQINAALSRDSLTRALRRETGEKEAAKRILGALSSPENTFALAILDIDHFKRLNDQFGHEKGNLALEAFSKTIQDHLRGGDVFCRWGGEEFFIAIQGVERAGFDKFLNRLREAVAAIRIETADRVITMTFSAGAAFLDELPAAGAWQAGKNTFSSPPQTGDPLFGTAMGFLTELLRKADQRLYKAKDHGRNRICLS